MFVHAIVFSTNHSRQNRSILWVYMFDYSYMLSVPVNAELYSGLMCLAVRKSYAFASKL